VKSHLLFLLCAGASVLAHYAILRVPIAPDPPVTVEPSVRLVLAARPDEPSPPPVDMAPAAVPDTPVREEPLLIEPPVEPDVMDEAVPAVIVISQEAIDETEESYWSEVCRGIAARLRYPLCARRGGCEDRVLVTLEIGPDGSLVSLDPVPCRAHPALVRAVESAVQRAAPFPPPPEILDPPVRAELPVRFELDR
jgi:protein TonB